LARPSAANPAVYSRPSKTLSCPSKLPDLPHIRPRIATAAHYTMLPLRVTLRARVSPVADIQNFIYLGIFYPIYGIRDAEITGLFLRTLPLTAGRHSSKLLPWRPPQ